MKRHQGGKQIGCWIRRGSSRCRGWAWGGITFTGWDFQYLTFVNIISSKTVGILDRIHWYIEVQRDTEKCISCQNSVNIFFTGSFSRITNTEGARRGRRWGWGWLGNQQLLSNTAMLHAASNLLNKMNSLLRFQKWLLLLHIGHLPKQYTLEVEVVYM